MNDELTNQNAPQSGDATAIDRTDRSAGRGALELPNRCTFTHTSLIIPETTTRAGWIDIGKELAAMVLATPFLIGDWVRFGEKKKFIRSDRYDEAAKETGLKRGTLKVYASVSKSVGPLMRINGLSFQHHQLVAPLPEKKQREMLERAVKEKMKVRQLRAVLSAPSRHRHSPLARAKVLQRLKGKLQRVVKDYQEWPELAEVIKAVEAL
jgi:hypothetical protein